MLPGVGLRAAHTTGSCLAVLIMLVRTQEMVSGAAGMDHKGAVRSQTWRNSLQKIKVKWQGIMELFSVKVGIVCIRAMITQLFLAITSQGRLYASETFTEDCLFREQMEENHYTTYSSHTHPRVFVALTKRGGPKNGSKARLHHPSTHFIPRMIRGS
ncbi:fibroblast growth factor 20-like [Pristis pectinata]|uniref:fibroblast growth factor 20-like n=1 Tax=Pristis pectinata TaxID=685728 RepID=UPI00223D04F0|nr:fibroblast growth factor 20-like [Pristis pectinata]